MQIQENGPGAGDTEAVSQDGFLSPEIVLGDAVPGAQRFYSGRPVMFSHDAGS